MSSPSLARRAGPGPTVVTASAASSVVIKNLAMAARRLQRLTTPSTVGERNAAIWRRVTLL